MEFTVTSSSEMSRPGMKAHEYRKIVKPLLERRRRARINHCLSDLKALLLENTQNIDSNEASKLEKADILELTVRHLKELRRQQRLLTCRGSPNGNSLIDSNEYRAGFAECAHEVSACLSSLPGLDAVARARLLAHLGSCVSHLSASNASSLPSSPTGTPTPPPSPGSPEYSPLSPATSPLDLTGRDWSFHQPSSYSHAESLDSNQPSGFYHVVSSSYRGLSPYSPLEVPTVRREPTLPGIKSCWRPW